MRIITFWGCRWSVASVCLYQFYSIGQNIIISLRLFAVTLPLPNVPYLLSDVICNGNETSLLECSYSRPQYCSYNRDIVLSCVGKRRFFNRVKHTQEFSYTQPYVLASCVLQLWASIVTDIMSGADPGGEVCGVATPLKHSATNAESKKMAAQRRRARTVRWSLVRQRLILCHLAFEISSPPGPPTRIISPYVFSVTAHAFFLRPLSNNPIG